MGSMRDDMIYNSAPKFSIIDKNASAEVTHFIVLKKFEFDEYDAKKFYHEEQYPLHRAAYYLKADLDRLKRRFKNAQRDYYGRMGLLEHPYRDPQIHEYIPTDPTVLIIGGGLMGSSIAWWLKQRCRDEDTTVTIIEGDHSFSKCSTVLSAGGIRQQFSIPENIEMSLFTAEFLRNAGEHLRILDSEPPDIHFTPMGYLFLATTQESADKLYTNWKTQTNDQY
uniref:FAD-dependent oxidoreductase domain-containing protein 1 n=1 Tax=Romanomermis culicivorax TaxID=13658 RepID=A0A915KYQ6_ROMCU